MLDRMEQLSARERRFVADASHELRSPIANIRTAVEVALHRPESADWQRVASEVLTEDGRMGRLVEELLLLARSDEGLLAHRVRGTRPPSGRPPCRLARLTTWGRRSVTVRGHARLMCWCPGAYLERIIANLVDNARRFATSRSRCSSVTTVAWRLWRCATTGRACPESARGPAYSSASSASMRPATGSTADSVSAWPSWPICATPTGGTIEVADANPGAVFLVRFPLAKTTRARRPLFTSTTRPRQPVPG